MIQFPPDWKSIARYGYFNGQNDLASLIVTNISNRDSHLIRKDESSSFTLGFSWAPDNKQLAYIVTDQQVAGTFQKRSKGYLFLYELEKDHTTKIGSENIYLTDPAWSPLGDVIAFFYGNGQISQENGSDMDYFLGDALGSVRQMTDDAGAATLTQSYDPYGNVLTNSGTASSIYGFDGEQRDSYIKLINLCSRMNDA